MQVDSKQQGNGSGEKETILIYSTYTTEAKLHIVIDGVQHFKKVKRIELINLARNLLETAAVLEYDT